MIAHTSLPVKDYQRSKAFYVKVLAPLGYQNNMEYGDAAGFNDGKNTDFWIHGSSRVVPTHLAFEAKSRDEVKAFYEGALAAGAYPLKRISAVEPPSPVMARLSSYMAEAKDRPLPPEAIEKTKQILLDTFAAMISGSELPPGRLAIQLARVHSGEKVATVAGSNVVCGPIEAALANGMLAHSDETDDSHAPSLSHPGCSVVPVARAASEQFDADGTRFLRAVALGYDIGPRMALALGGDLAMFE